MLILKKKNQNCNLDLFALIILLFLCSFALASLQYWLLVIDVLFLLLFIHRFDFLLFALTSIFRIIAHGITQTTYLFN